MSELFGRRGRHVLGLGLRRTAVSGTGGYCVGQTPQLAAAAGVLLRLNDLAKVLGERVADGGQFDVFGGQTLGVVGGPADERYIVNLSAR